MGSPADSTVNALIFTPLLRYRLESVALEHSLTFFAEKIGNECGAKRLITSSENRNRIGSDDVHLIRYVDDLYLIAGRRGVET